MNPFPTRPPSLIGLLASVDVKQQKLTRVRDTSCTLRPFPPGDPDSGHVTRTLLTARVKLEDGPW